jgi:hypothetical protein
MSSALYDEDATSDGGFDIVEKPTEKDGIGRSMTTSANVGSTTDVESVREKPTNDVS